MRKVSEKNKMKSCVFFGHRDITVDEYREDLKNILTDLIENKGVTQFYSGFRGYFDVFCSNLVYELKSRYPQIKNTMVLSYMPKIPDDPDFAYELQKCFDDSVYLLERQIPKPYAILETNKCLVDKCDYIVAAVNRHFGGAYAACEYALKRKKPIINLFSLYEL